MTEMFLILLGIGYLIYRVAFGIPKDIKSLESKVDMLSLHLKEVELKLTRIENKLDKKQ